MNDARSLFGDRTPTLPAARAAFLDHLRLLGRSEATVRAHHNALGQFAKVWGERDLREAMPSDLEAYARSVLGRVARESAYVYLNGLRSFFRFLVESGVLLVDPAAGMPMPRMRERMTGRILSREEMTRLVESPDVGAPQGLRDRALLEFLYSTGLRVSEARRVKVADLGADSVTVRGGKGGKDRVVPVGIAALRWVRKYLAEARPLLAVRRAPVEELFVSDLGNPFGKQMFAIHLRELGEAAGIPHLTCHTIRRSMATQLLAAGASPQEVSGILGHSDLKSLSRYVQVASRELKETHQATHPREEP